MRVGVLLALAVTALPLAAEPTESHEGYAEFRRREIGRAHV